MLYSVNKPELTAQRLLHYAHFLSEFKYKIEYRKTNDHQNVDFFSRDPLEKDEELCEIYKL